MGNIKSESNTKYVYVYTFFSTQTCLMLHMLQFSSTIFKHDAYITNSIISFLGNGRPGRSKQIYFFLFCFLVITILQTHCLENKYPSHAL
jgi:hypothetical protein